MDEVHVSIVFLCSFPSFFLILFSSLHTCWLTRTVVINDSGRGYNRCPRCKGEDSRVPAMCLVCGEVVCSQSYCCQTDVEGVMVGAATLHANVCGAGTGIFLRYPPFILYIQLLLAI